MCDRALVVFCHDTSIHWLRVLRPGFRHCFVLLESGHEQWVALDPLASRIEVTAGIVGPAADLSAAFERQGHIVVETRVRGNALPVVSLSLYSCVDFVKRVLRLNRNSLLTPFQLYSYLTDRKGDDHGIDCSPT